VTDNLRDAINDELDRLGCTCRPFIVWLHVDEATDTARADIVHSDRCPTLAKIAAPYN
jgi:hypothetical protein